MHNLSLLFFLLVLSLNFACGSVLNPVSNAEETTAPIATDAKPKWKAGEYKGLKIGKSTVDDMNRLLGKPTDPAGSPVIIDESEIKFVYEIYEPKVGKIIIYSDKKTGVILSIEMNFEEMTREEVERTYGKGFTITNYSMQSCPGDPFDAAGRYQDPAGEIGYTEYRELGIGISFSNYDGKELVQHIIYSEEPPGREKKGCD